MAAPNSQQFYYHATINLHRFWDQELQNLKQQYIVAMHNAIHLEIQQLGAPVCSSFPFYMTYFDYVADGFQPPHQRSN